ncbi:MAG TPA: hypothetical protein VM782_14975, partial [Stellaceae bacterium]|nr:hypothetical protein [Stellaceae bacterium]
MKLLSHPSPNSAGGSATVPAPADPRLQSLGQEAWSEVLASADAEHPGAAAAARAWSATSRGQALLAAIFGNSPFLTGVAVREWEFLTRLVENGPDPLFQALIADTKRPIDGGDTAELMRRLRIARRRVALTAALAELTGAWTLEQQMAALTRFAEAAIEAAITHLLRATPGTP